MSNQTTESTAKKIVGIPWYVRRHYDSIRNLTDHDSKLPMEYGVWLNAATTMEMRMIQTGCTVVRIHIDPFQFIDWCDLRKKKLNARARDSYAMWLLSTKVKSPLN